MTRRGIRGQATVELALGSLVFVTILLFGIYFAEFGTLKLRVQQAATTALFDATGMRSHDFTQSDVTDRFTRVDRITYRGKTPSERAQDAYEDFDDLASGSGTTTLSVTKGAELRVACNPRNIQLQRPNGPLRSAIDTVKEGYDNIRSLDTLECRASASIVPFGLPETFFDRGDRGFFRADSRPSAITVCAFGRKGSNGCDGKVGIAIDDWGLGGTGQGRRGGYGHEWQECTADGTGSCLYGSSGNQAYKKIVQRMYTKYAQRVGAGSGTSSPLATFLKELYTKTPDYPELGFTVPTDERDFRFVFIGEDGAPGAPAWARKPFQYATQEGETSGLRPRSMWPSSPYSDRYRDAHQKRGNCFLGSQCSEPMFKKASW